ncbi:MAG: hypothetical protein WED04_10565 [Promethearchaeati archaeon SRVP18_Atabeyarchaeia-1]
MSERKDEDFSGEIEREEPWVDLLDRIDSTNFSRLFRDIVLVAGLLHLREAGECAMKDLQVIIQETESFSKRITFAKQKHPEVDILSSIQSNLGEFSVQTCGFEKALLASELREELELLSLCLLLSRSRRPEGRTRKHNLARRLTKLARRIKIKDDVLREAESRKSTVTSFTEERKGEKERRSEPGKSI